MGFFKKSEISKNYVMGDTLGSGNFATVKRAQYKGKEKIDSMPENVAVKIIDKSKVEDMNDIQREIEIMQMVKHKNIIALFEIYDEPKKMHLVMELVTGGELFDRIVQKQKYSEKEAAGCMAQLCEALHFLHDKKIVHRDLKPENILYESPDSDTIKVADFGLARVVSGKDVMKTACGTPGYVAPEILKNQGYDSGAVDIWSAGVILYILLCGFPPFYEEELPALFDQILHARYDFPSPWWDHISSDAKELVRNMLELNVEKRFTAKQVLEHSWMKNAPDIHLEGALKSLKKFNASRKLKKAAMGIIAQGRFRKMMDALSVADGAPAK
mmetsp:Transcript_12136/g.38934  ORF Transcript_12136/g.38934 Transcript_12136/m.38934 type:complete len:328 (+) Transcript_12136:50-1033(+)